MRYLLLSLFLLMGCSKAASTLAPLEKKPLILVSIAPYRSFVERIAGPEFSVQVIVPQGDSAHSYEPTARQIAQMSEGQVWFRIGEPFEMKVEPFLKAHNPELAVLDLREGIDLLEEEGSGCHHCEFDHQDRHIWMSPKLAMEQVLRMTHFLQGVFPESKELFQANAEQLCQELAMLDGEIAAILKSASNRVILVSHPAFGYFCREYQCKQLSIEYEGKDPRPQHLEKVLHQAMDQHVALAIALPQYNNKGAQRIAEQLQLPVQMVDPYSPQYFQTMRRLALWISDPHNPQS